MTDEWFTEYMFQLCVRRSFLPAEQREMLSLPATKLPPWDPMGALARTYDPRGDMAAL